MSTQFGSLADGRYTLTALASQISVGGVLLDINGDGQIDGVEFSQFSGRFNTLLP